MPDFDDKVASMSARGLGTRYARGLGTRAIRDHLEEPHGIDVSPDLISTVTSAVLEEVAERQGRPLDVCCPLVLLDAIGAKIRDKGFARNKAARIALGHPPRWDARGPGALDRASQRGEVLAARDERAQGSRRPKRPDRRRPVG